MLPARLSFKLPDTSWITQQIRSCGIERFDALCAAVAAVAQASGRPDVRLVVGIYRMSEANTPGVGVVLKAARLPYILEAHCYLRLESERFDFTGLGAGCTSVFSALVSEHNVSVESLILEKAALHQRALKAWAPSFGLGVEQAWSIRDACIAALQA